MSRTEQVAPLNFFLSCSCSTIDDAQHLQQAVQDAQVVREIIAGCPELQKQRNWYVTSSLFVLAQAFANLLIRR